QAVVVLAGGAAGGGAAGSGVTGGGVTGSGVVGGGITGSGVAGSGAVAAPAVADLASPLADELCWELGRAYGLAARLTAAVLHAQVGSALLALVSGPVASPDAGDPRVVRAALLGEPDEPGRRVCQGALPDAGRVAGSGTAEVAAAVEGFAERITAACALDAELFPAHAALRA